jgi:signal transduction histidine kinase
VAAVHLEPGASVHSLYGQALMASLGGRTVELDGWLSVPVPGDPSPVGVLTLHKTDSWTARDQESAELAAGVLGLGLMLSEARRFDDRERDQFLALIGHDLRSPLSNVRVGAQLARRNLAAGDTESVEEALTIIEHQSGRLLDRLQALLDAVAASGRWLIRLQPLDLGDLAETALAPFRLAAQESGLGTRFEIAVAPGTPAARGDAGQIAQVFEQLIDNAAKYAAGGHVRIDIAPAGTSVRVDVCDDGPGIRPEDLDRVFAPFGRGRSAAQKDGYGLGLYLARNIVTAHGGRLWIGRTSRSGTCMAMTLPVARPEDA